MRHAMRKFERSSAGMESISCETYSSPGYFDFSRIPRVKVVGEWDISLMAENKRGAREVAESLDF